MKNIEILGGGTVYHVRNHLALAAPAYGSTARKLYSLAFESGVDHYDINLHLTKMASHGEIGMGETNLETNEDVSKLVDKLIANPDTKIIFFNVALVDFEGSITTEGAAGYEWNDSLPTRSGKYETRLKTSEGQQKLLLTPSAKIISKIRARRKDIFLVGFKTTCGATEDEQFLTGLHLLKSSSCNLVLANDTKTRTNMIITPEQARYNVTTDREEVLDSLVQMALSRSQGNFTRSTVVPGETLSWNHDTIPSTLRQVVNHCITQGAYKPFNGSTVGHFAVKMPMNDWIATSKRKTDFNKLDEVGLVLCQPVGNDIVRAIGGKPSVGGQSQRIIFKDHPEMDCIVHFHCPVRKHALSDIVQHDIPVRSQKEFECGSHECGKNTSTGLKEVTPGIKAVFLDNHGPNIVFNRNIDPQKVIDFIDRNFDLSKATDQVDRNVHSLQL